MRMNYIYFQFDQQQKYIPRPTIPEQSFALPNEFAAEILREHKVTKCTSENGVNKHNIAYALY